MCHKRKCQITLEMISLQCKLKFVSGDLDKSSLHGGCDAIKGEIWFANHWSMELIKSEQWIINGPFSN